MTYPNPFTVQCSRANIYGFLEEDLQYGDSDQGETLDEYRERVAESAEDFLRDKGRSVRQRF